MNITKESADSSDAADPWEGFTGESPEERGYAEGWKAGRAEVEALREQLAAAEAVIEKS